MLFRTVPLKKNVFSSIYTAWPLLAVGLCAIIVVAVIALVSRRSPPDYKKLNADQLRSIVAQRPAPEAYLALFQRNYDAGKREEALKTARDMVRRFPTDARSHNALGIAYAAVDDPASAKKAFHNAISLDPHRVDPYVNLGRLSLLTGDAQQAANEFDLATTVDPNSPSAWTGYGEANAAIYNSVEATEAFERAIRLAPNRPQAYAHLGTFLAEMGSGDKARPHLERAQQLGDHSAVLFAGLAMAYADQPRSQAELTQALDYAKQAQELGDSSGLVYYAQGLALQRLGRYQEAITSFKRVNAVSDNSNGAWIGMSQCYRALGKKKLADEAAKTGERILSERLHLSNLKHEIATSPNRLDLREKYADALISNGQYLLAAEQYRYSAMHTRDSSSLWLKAAHAFDLGGEKDLANYVRHLADEKPSTSRGAAPGTLIQPGKPGKPE